MKTKFKNASGFKARLIISMMAFVISGCASISANGPPEPELRWSASQASSLSAPQKPKLAVVFSSGAMRGYAHIGVIRAFEKAGIRPDLIVGTSVGAIVGGL